MDHPVSVGFELDLVLLMILFLFKAIRITCISEETRKHMHVRVCPSTCTALVYNSEYRGREEMQLRYFLMQARSRYVGSLIY